MRKTHFLAIGLATLPIALTAGDTHLGIEATAQKLIDRADLRDGFGDQSLGLGLLAEIQTTPESAFRIRFDYTKGHEIHRSGSSTMIVNGQPQGNSFTDSRTYLETMSLMGDYLVDVGPSHQAYFLAGLGLNRTTAWLDYTLITTTLSVSGPTENSTSKVASNLGFGWRFTPSASAEVRYFHSGDFNRQTYDRAELAVIWKF